MLKSLLCLGMSNDRAWLYAHAAPVEALPRLRAECNDPASGHVGTAQGLRRVLGKALHPNAMEIAME